MPPDGPELPATPEALLEAARKLRFEASVLVANAAAKVNQAEAYEALAGVRRSIESRLTTEDELNTLGEMNASVSSNGLRSRKQLDANPTHPFVAMLRRTGTTVPEVAAFLETKHPDRKSVPRNTVQSWYKKAKADGARRIPEWAAKAIEAKYGVPLDAWPRRKPEV